MSSCAGGISPSCQANALEVSHSPSSYRTGETPTRSNPATPPLQWLFRNLISLLVHGLQGIVAEGRAVWR